MSMHERNLEQEYNDLKKDFETFVYIVSHDFKAPLRAISNLSDWIAEDLGEDLNEEVGNNLALLRNRVGHLENMLNGLLLLSRVARTDLDRGDVVLTEMIETLVHQLDPKGKTALTLDIDLLPFFTWRKKLYTVLEALFSNAIRYADPANPTLLVSATVNDNVLSIRVLDNGNGIPANLRDRLFQIFTTSENSYETNYMGNGLALAKKIVEFTGGNLTFHPETTTGADFRFTWPLDHNPIEA